MTITPGDAHNCRIWLRRGHTSLEALALRYGVTVEEARAAIFPETAPISPPLYPDPPAPVSQRRERAMLKKVDSHLVDVVVGVVAETYGVPVEAIMSRRRMRIYTEARGMAMRVIQNMAGVSLTWIGAQFDRDHSTVCVAIAKQSGNNDLARALQNAAEHRLRCAS